MIRVKNQSICILFRERNRKCQDGIEKSIWMHLVHGVHMEMPDDDYIDYSGCRITVDDFYADASGRGEHLMTIILMKAERGGDLEINT